MKKTLYTLTLAAALTLPMTSCYTMKHKVGNGGTTESEATERQWFILWGLVPLNDVDSHAMADGASDYTVQTEMTVLDVVMNFFTAWVTIYSREYKVTK